MKAVNVWIEGGSLICQTQEGGRFYLKEDAEFEVARLRQKVERAEKVISIIRDFVEEVASERQERIEATQLRPMTALAVRATAIKEFLYPEGGK